MKKNSLLMMLYELLGLIVPLILTPYLSRKLGASGIGLYSYSYSIALYFVIFIQLGVKLYGKREIAKVNDNTNKYSSVFLEIFIVQVCLFIIVSFVYAGFINLGIKIESIKNALVIQGIELIVGLLDISWFFFGLERFKTIVIRNCIVRIFEILLVFSFIHESDDSYIYILIMAGSNFVGVLSMWLEVRRLVVFRLPKYSSLKKRVLPLFHLFIPVLSTQIFSIVDKTVIGSVLSVEQVGYYENAYKIAKVPVVFITSIGNVMLPRVTKLIADGKIDSSRIYLRKSMTIVIMMTSAIAFGLAAISNIFIPLYLGPGFKESIELLTVLPLILIFIGWGNVLRTQYMLPMGYDNLYIKSVVYAAISNVVLSVVLVMPFGTLGVAIASLVCEIIICLYTTVKLRKELPVKSLFNDNCKYLLFGVVMFLVVRIVNHLLNKELNIGQLLLEIAIGSIVYIGLIISIEKVSGKYILLLEIQNILDGVVN